MTITKLVRSRIARVLPIVVLSLVVCRVSSYPTVYAAPRGTVAESADAADTGAAGSAEALTKPHATTTVLVELFTSEGCSSCPSADSLLARLQREQPVPDADILALEEHVDYWDSPQSRDRFSSRQFSVRQSAYSDRLLLNREYTPQMIVDGTEELVGNDIVRAFHAIAQAALSPKLALMLSPLAFDGTHLVGKVSLPRLARAEQDRWEKGRLEKTGRGAVLYAAVVESVASTHVLDGENGGQTLNHVSVVRAMRKIGSLAAATAGPLKFSLDVPDDLPAKDLRVVVFIQRAGQGAVLGAISSTPAITVDYAAEIASGAPTHAR